MSPVLRVRAWAGESRMETEGHALMAGFLLPSSGRSDVGRGHEGQGGCPKEREPAQPFPDSGSVLLQRPFLPAPTQLAWHDPARVNKPPPRRLTCKRACGRTPLTPVPFWTPNPRPGPGLSPHGTLQCASPIKATPVACVCTCPQTLLAYTDPGGCPLSFFQGSRLGVNSAALTLPSVRGPPLVGRRSRHNASDPWLNGAASESPPCMVDSGWSHTRVAITNQILSRFTPETSNISWM